jgi:hypothetical protein
MNWGMLVSMIASIALSLDPATAPFAPYIGQAINSVEAEFTKDPTLTPAQNSAAKLANGVSIVNDLVEAANVAKPGLVNVPVANDLVAKSISAVVDAANLFSKTATA